jgi:MFS family permease
MFPIAFSIIKDQFPREKLAIGVGVFSSMFAAGSVVGLALGANIIQNFGWRTTFFSIVFVAIALWFIIRRYIDNDLQDSANVMQSAEMDISSDLNDDKIKVPNEKDTIKNKSKNIDIKGTIALAITISSFLMVLSYSQTNHIESSLIAIFLSLGTISLLFFIIIEKRSNLHWLIFT